MQHRARPMLLFGGLAFLFLVFSSSSSSSSHTHGRTEVIVKTHVASNDRFPSLLTTTPKPSSSSPAPSPSPSTTDAKKSKIISFGLYGNNPRYTNGAKANVLLQKEFFPDWTCRFYIDNTVPADVVKYLQDNGAEIVSNTDSIKGGIAGMFWRFLVAEDPSIERFIVRDADSRLSARDKAIVEEWEKSGKTYHVIRDHPSHSNFAMSGGMWGGKYSPTLQLAEKMQSHNNKNEYIEDMNFLNARIWPIIKDDSIQHDSFSCVQYGARPFPVKRNGGEHIGAVYDGEGRIRQGDVDILLAAPKHPECEPQ
eukprot:GILI01017893.1.p1 GENE.GILI01017893.1~~GILI01017893.1.p1  ORF type:complete len:361 (+),score=69.57 GILI01017893.1:157-1083(+)